MFITPTRIELGVKRKEIFIMNKLFTKIAAAFVGIAMAIGVGIAVGNSGVREAKATETVAYTLDGTSTSGGSSAYASGTLTQGAITWTAQGNTTYNPWRIGGNSLSSVDRLFYSQNAMSQTITKIKMSFGASSGSITVNSITLRVYSTAAAAATPDANYLIDTKTFTYSASGNSTVTPSAGKSWAGRFYRFEFNVTVSGNNNKYISLSSIQFYHESEDPAVNSVTLDIHSAKMIVGNTVELKETVNVSNGAAKTVTWSSSNNEIATVSEGVVTGVAAGTATITCASSVQGFTNVKDTCSVTVFAADSETEMTFEKYDCTASDDTITVNNGTFTTVFAKTGVDKETAPVYNDTGKAVRAYRYNTVTVSMNSNSAKLTSISFTFASGENDNVITSDVGTYNDGVWNGNSKTVVFTIGAKTDESTGGHRRFQKIDIAFDDGTPRVNSVTLDKHLATIYRTGTTTVTLTPTVEVTNEAAQTVSWGSSEEGVATVSNGVVTAVGVGTTTITCASSVSGFENIKDTCVVRVFAAADGDDEITFAKQNYANEEVLSGKTLEKTNFSLQFVKNSGSDAKYYLSNTTARVYTNNTMVLSSATKTIKKISFTIASGEDKLSADVGYYDSENARWTGASTSVTFTLSGTTQLSSLSVEYVSSDAILGWIDTYLYMEDARFSGQGSGLCSSNGLYLAAKSALNDLTPAQINSFKTNEGGLYTDALARYNAWAVYCNDGEPFDGNDTIETPLRASLSFGAVAQQSSSTTTIVIIISIIGISAVGAFFMIRRRKEL